MFTIPVRMLEKQVTGHHHVLCYQVSGISKVVVGVMALHDGHWFIE